MAPIKPSLKNRKERINQASPYATRSSSNLVKSSAAIDKLNEDCLRLIFGYLEAPELINIERVCKKWREVCWGMWACRKSFNAREDFRDFYCFEHYHLESILKRCGRSLTNLNIDHIYAQGKPFIPVINKYCKNLTHLDLSAVKFQANDFRLLKKSIVQNLKSLCLDDHHLDDEYDTGLSTLLKNAVNLEEFVMSFDCGTGEELLNISTKCRRLSISICYDVKDYMFKQILNRLPCLEILEVGHTDISPETLVPLSSQLTKVDLSGTKNIFKDDNYKILRFQNLKELTLAENDLMGDEHVSHFIKNCPLLEEISLNNCLKVTDNGFRLLENLKNLVKLHVNKTQTSDECLEYLAAKSGRYKCISVGECENVTEEGIIRVIGCLLELKYLIFHQKTKPLGETLFKKILETVLLRPNYTTLSVHLGHEQMGFNMGVYDAEPENTVMEMKRLGLTTNRNGPLKTKRLKVLRWIESDVYIEFEPETLFVLSENENL